MGKNSPDMRIFNSTVATDHTMFDSCLVRLRDSTSNWTNSKLQGDVPVTLEHFQQHTLERLISVLKDAPELSGQKFDEQRLLLQHIAYRLPRISGQHVHTWHEPVENLLMRMRVNLNLIARDRLMVCEDLKNPLATHFKARQTKMNADGRSSPTYKPAIKVNAADQALAKYLIGPNPNVDSDTEHMRGVFEQVSPFLLELEPESIDTKLFELRKKLRTILENRLMLSDDLRSQILDATMEDWEDMYLNSGEMPIFDDIEQDVQEETGIEKAFENKPKEILKKAFNDPLAPEIIDEEMRAKLIKRRPLLEYFVLQAQEEKDGQFLQELNNTFNTYWQKLKLNAGDLDHLFLAMYAMGVNVTIEEYRDALS